MKNNLTSIFYIIIASSLLGLLYNLINPKGISLIKDERVLEWADESINDNINSSQLSAKEEKNTITKMDEAKAITLKRAYELFNDNAIFIDARDFVEFEIGRIKNAISLPYIEFEETKSVLENISVDRAIVTYCDGKDCDLSIHLGDKLFEMGYKEVYIFFGGWVDWQLAGYPIETDE